MFYLISILPSFHFPNYLLMTLKVTQVQITNTPKKPYMEFTIKEIKSLVKQQVYNAQGMLSTLYAFRCLKMYQLIFDLDYIIDQGDNLMKRLRVHESLAVNELSLSVKLKECEIGNDTIFIWAGISFAFICGKKIHFFIRFS